MPLTNRPIAKIRKGHNKKNVKIGKCHNWKMSVLERVRIVGKKCNNRKESKMAITSCEKCIRIRKSQDWRESEDSSKMRQIQLEKLLHMWCKPCPKRGILCCGWYENGNNIFSTTSTETG